MAFAVDMQSNKLTHTALLLYSHPPMMFQSDYFLMSIVYPIVIPLSSTAMQLGLSQFAAKMMMLLQLQAKLLEPAQGVLIAPQFDQFATSDTNEIHCFQGTFLAFCRTTCK